MSNDVNKAIILGRLGKDPEIRYSSSGAAIANFTVATGESWKNKETGEKEERTEWHRVTAFGKLAEIIGEYLKKGSQVYIEGRLQTRKWQDQNGSDRYTTEIVLSGFDGVLKMLGGGGRKEDGGGTYADKSGTYADNSGTYAEQAGSKASEEFDDDIPF